MTFYKDKNGKSKLPTMIIHCKGDKVKKYYFNQQLKKVRGNKNG